MPEEITQGIWKHWKGGEYDVIGVAVWRDARALLGETIVIANRLEFVVYRPRQGERLLEARPVAEWLEHIKRKNYQGPRYWLLMSNREGQKP